MPDSRAADLCSINEQRVDLEEELVDLVIMAILAVVCGSDGREGIVDLLRCANHGCGRCWSCRAKTRAQTCSAAVPR